MSFREDLGDKIKPLLTNIKKQVRERVKMEQGSAKVTLQKLRLMSEEDRRELIARVGEDAFISRVEALMERAAQGG